MVTLPLCITFYKIMNRCQPFYSKILLRCFLWPFCSHRPILYFNGCSVCQEHNHQLVFQAINAVREDLWCWAPPWLMIILSHNILIRERLWPESGETIEHCPSMERSRAESPWPVIGVSVLRSILLSTVFTLMVLLLLHAGDRQTFKLKVHTKDIPGSLSLHWT